MKPNTKTIKNYLNNSLKKISQNEQIFSLAHLHSAHVFANSIECQRFNEIQNSKHPQAMSFVQIKRRLWCFLRGPFDLSMWLLILMTPKNSNYLSVKKWSELFHFCRTGLSYDVFLLLPFAGLKQKWRMPECRDEGDANGYRGSLYKRKLWRKQCYFEFHFFVSFYK